MCVCVCVPLSQLQRIVIRGFDKIWKVSVCDGGVVYCHIRGFDRWGMCVCVCVCVCACSCYFSHLRGDIERPVVCNPTLLPMGVIQGHGARSISGLHQGRVSQLSVITLNHTPSTEGHKRVPAGMA